MENNTWSYVRKGLNKVIPRESRMDRVENLLGSGMADVNYCIEGSEGWIENKFLKKYPARPGTPVKIKWQPEQRPWLISQTRAGGRAFVLIQVDKDYFLYNADSRINLIGTMNKAQLWANATCVWERFIHFPKLKEILCR